MALTGTQLYGATTLAWPILLWLFLALPILLLVHFGADLFGTNFIKIFFLLIFFQFLIYKKFFLVFHFYFYFSKTVEDFLLFVLKFLSILHKKIQVQTQR